ncbi:unnamed protein product [Diabrotica balteata]|uniref:Uncharacterized protein n=1 Tax=Diabrotica balteata TaxID=107213 RepID=A0A9N9T4L9_DIABA|nr:unnamed protein product [Diabrotica balteata]
MSRHPQYEYRHNNQRKYYVDNNETEYTDSDCQMDTAHRNLHTIPAPPHLDEIYSKHSTIVPIKVVPLKKATKMVSKQQSEKFAQESYYDHNNVPPATTIPPKAYYPNGFDSVRSIYPVCTAFHPNSDHYVNTFTNPYHNQELQQFSCQNCQAKSTSSKRFPVKVRTPKYYKKPQSSGVFKRPSALCLPVATQPDPAVIRRPKRAYFSENIYGMQETQELKSLQSMIANQLVEREIPPHRVDSEGDVNASVKSLKIPPLDKYFEGIEKNNICQNGDNNPDLAKITKLLKPKIPASVKARQEKNKAKILTKKQSLEKMDNQTEKRENKEPAESSKVSLEKLLNQLKKCEESAGKQDVVKEEETKNKRTQVDKKEQKRSECGERSEYTDEEKFDVRSFNYHDITNHLYKSQSDFKDSESVASIQEITKKLTSTVIRPLQQTCMKPLDDHHALELHKSKSYIVNLIDRALSKELGTVPCDRHRNNCETMNRKKTIETNNRHIEKSERDIAVEITSALADSLISNATCHDMEESERKASKAKLCYCNSEEPIYIKQLKQLRWGHLKHIQREVKRLEDLERFLDSCSITTVPEI